MLHLSPEQTFSSYIKIQGHNHKIKIYNKKTYLIPSPLQRNCLPNSRPKKAYAPTAKTLLPPPQKNKCILYLFLYPPHFCFLWAQLIAYFQFNFVSSRIPKCSLPQIKSKQNVDQIEIKFCKVL